MENQDTDETEKTAGWDTDFVTDKDGCLTFAPSSPLRPMNWSTKKKLVHTALFGMTTFAAQLNSTSMSTDILARLFKEQFGISREVTLLATTFYILGIAFGPMVFAPLSEVYGRKLGVLVPFFISGVLTFVVACSSSIPAILIFRFIAGFFAGAPVVSSGGVLADIWSPAQRGMALGFYAFFVANGPSFGPTISSLLMHASDKVVSWRNPQYFCGSFNICLFALCEVICCESFEPLLLSREAKRLRLETGQWHLHCAHDKWTLTASELYHVHLLRPFKMLVSPVIFVVAIFASYVFGLFYMLITGIDIVFSITKGWSGTVATLPNIAIFLGVSAGLGVNMFWGRIYGKKLMANNGVPMPEERFPPLMYVAWTLPVGIFLFAWTSWKSVHWIVPCIGIAFAGLGVIVIFQGCLNYLVDTNRKYAASAIAANTILRSILAAVFPLFSGQLFHNLGVHWGGSLIGFIALGMIPIPWVFYKYGETLRNKYPPQF
ncbi:hypothetical protein JA9_003182 [Meyerozyma sp. JA9]|nr:hypothetical protein JA9_003182 [Meyerozyma sp. JA9]